MFELEKRIWAGIVDQDNTRSPVKYLPSPFVDTWYDKNKVDNYTEQLYADWSAKEKVVGYNTANYYDASDDKTWNYSPPTYNGKQMPGHWKGAYTYISGTCTPHLTPGIC